MGHTAVSAIKASSVTFSTWQKEAEENTVIWQMQLDVVPCGGYKKSPRTHL